jgi:hypothetical protein
MTALSVIVNTPDNQYNSDMFNWAVKTAITEAGGVIAELTTDAAATRQHLLELVKLMTLQCQMTLEDSGITDKDWYEQKMEAISGRDHTGSAGHRKDDEDGVRGREGTGARNAT